MSDPNREKPEPNPFTTTIKNLEQRAKSSRARVRIISICLWASAASIVSFITYRQIDKIPENTITEVSLTLGEMGIIGKQSLPTRTEGHVDFLLDKLESEPIANTEARLLVRAELAEAVSYLEKIREPQQEQRDYSPIIINSVFSLGAVAFVILLIQISVMFMRYHTKLAELYDSQADALRASKGNMEHVLLLLQHLSPNNIDFGKTPSALFEKALETIQDVAKSPKAP